MLKNAAKKKSQSIPGTNPSVNSDGGRINFSGPTGNDRGADLSRLTSGSAYEMSSSQPGSNPVLRPAAGNADDLSETRMEEEIMERAEEGGRGDPGMADWAEAMESKAGAAIRHRKAA